MRDVGDVQHLPMRRDLAEQFGIRDLGLDADQVFGVDVTARRANHQFIALAQPQRYVVEGDNAAQLIQQQTNHRVRVERCRQAA